VGVNIPDKIQAAVIRRPVARMAGRARMIWAVNANWNAGNGWNLNAKSVANPNAWNAGNLIFSLSLIFSRLSGGSFTC